jgi:hypothetical protein
MVLARENLIDEFFRRRRAVETITWRSPPAKRA